MNERLLVVGMTERLAVLVRAAHISPANRLDILRLLDVASTPNAAGRRAYEEALGALCALGALDAEELARVTDDACAAVQKAAQFSFSFAVF